MGMQPRRVFGLYATRGAAEVARERLVRRGLLPQQLTMLQQDRDESTGNAGVDRDDVLFEMLRGGAVGAVSGMAAGIVLGGIVALALPVFPALASILPEATMLLLAWAAAIGSVPGGIAGGFAASRNRKGNVADLLGVTLARGEV